MALSAIVLATGMLALGPQWALIDLPYPEATGAQSGSVHLDSRLAEAVTHYARARAGKSLNRKPEIAPLQVEADTARVRVSFGDRTEVVILVRVKNEWRVVEAMTQGRED